MGTGWLDGHRTAHTDPGRGGQDPREPGESRSPNIAPGGNQCTGYRPVPRSLRAALRGNRRYRCRGLEMGGSAVAGTPAGLRAVWAGYLLPPRGGARGGRGRGGGGEIRRRSELRSHGLEAAARQGGMLGVAAR